MPLMQAQDVLCSRQQQEMQELQQQVTTLAIAKSTAKVCCTAKQAPGVSFAPASKLSAQI